MTNQPGGETIFTLSQMNVVKQYRILVVDDDPKITLLLTGLLEDNGYQVLTAANGETAIDCAITEQPDLVLLDIQLPDMDGTLVYATFRQISQTCQIPVIFITGLDTSEHIERTMSIGWCDLVYKPIHLGKLLVRIQAVLQTRHIVDQAERLKSYNETLRTLLTQLALHGHSNISGQHSPVNHIDPASGV